MTLLSNIANGYINLARKQLDIANEGVEELAVTRFATCLACIDPQAVNPEDQPGLRPNQTCYVCRCYMPAKVRAVNAKCPIGKW